MSTAFIASDFESLGHNCEFGFVLKSLGVSSSSLLRWAYVQTTDGLIEALNDNFARLFVNPETLIPCFGRTMIEDSTFGIAFHTKINSVFDGDAWTVERGESFWPTYENERRKIAYMASSFMHILSEGNKVFVYKGKGTISDEDGKRLHTALSRLGRNRLLLVDLADNLHSDGEVRIISTGVYRGFISYFSPYEKVDDVNLPSWTNLLQNVRDRICLDL